MTPARPPTLQTPSSPGGSSVDDDDDDYAAAVAVDTRCQSSYGIAIHSPSGIPSAPQKGVEMLARDVMKVI